MRYHNTKQAAKIIGRSARQVQRYCEQGLLKGQFVGGRYIIGENEAKAFIPPLKGRRPQSSG
jgi:hypothetical protein